MSDDAKRKPFSLDGAPTTFTLRDLDNAAPRLRPKGLVLDHPRLAPPGMSGIKPQKREWTHAAKSDGMNINVSVRIVGPSSLSKDPELSSARPRLALGQEGEAKRAFAPLITRPNDKDRGHQR